MEMMVQLTILGDIVLAALLGGLIGLERELAKKPAGLRTHMLVAAAAAALVALGDIVIEKFASGVSSQIIGADPTRIIQAIIVGISFVGAGTVMHRQEEGTVENLTTAASILFVTTVGISVALDQYYLAIGISLVTVIINALLIRLETAMDQKNRDKKV